MRAISHALVAALAVVLGASTGRAQGPNLRVQVPGVEGVVLLDSIARRVPLTAPVERVLTAIHEAFGEYGLKADEVEPAAGRLPSRRVNLSRRIGKTPMSRYLDCGRGFSGENANIYRITLVVAAWPLRSGVCGKGQVPGGLGSLIAPRPETPPVNVTNSTL